jgi:cell division protein FtsI (penicillin-binding protein 3)
MNKSDGWLRFRIVVVFGFFVFLFSVVFARAFQIQVIEGESLMERAKNQHQSSIKLPSKRGAILDRNLKELAVSMEVDSVYAQPPRIEDSARASLKVASALKINHSAVKKHFSSKKNFVWLKRQIDLNSERRGELRSVKGIGLLKESRRFYPGKELAANLMGFTGIDADGLEGLELRFDKYMRGESRTIKVGRDAKGNLLTFEELGSETRGMDLVLTIDSTIQYIAERALKKMMIKTGAKGGMAIVMDPYTGELLALANAPTFDPNNIRGFTPNDWRNRALTDAFEPGSTMKAFLLAALLEEGTADVDDIFFCENGSYDVADRTFHDTKEYGWMTLSDIIKHSSNIGAAKAGRKLGEKRYYSYLKDFGFGEKTGIGLPGESRGLLRHYSKWSAVTLETISFGQGIATTAIQLTSAMSAIANGGILMEPRAVKYLRNHNGDIVEEFAPTVVRRVVSSRTADLVTGVLKTVTEAGGTGELASLGSDFTVAGKTGTAQKADLKNGGYIDDVYISSFLGFVPADKPRLTILVTVDEPVWKNGVGSYSGGQVAAPVFKEIARDTLSYLGVFSEKTTGEPLWVKDLGIRDEDIFSAKQRDDDEGLVATSLVDSSVYGPNPPVVPDFKGKSMRAVIRMASESSLDLDIQGSGVAFSQTPVYGEMIQSGKRVEVVFH